MIIPPDDLVGSWLLKLARFRLPAIVIGTELMAPDSRLRLALHEVSTTISVGRHSLSERSVIKVCIRGLSRVRVHPQIITRHALVCEALFENPATFATI